MERGVRFVQIFASSTRISGGAVADVPWDGHNDIDANHRDCAASTDQPVGGLADRPEGARPAGFDAGDLGRRVRPDLRFARQQRAAITTRRLTRSAWPAAASRAASITARADDFGYKAVENRVGVNDLHATILHLLGLEHTKLTYRFNGRDFRLTDVAGKVIKEIIA